MFRRCSSIPNGTRAYYSLPVVACMECAGWTMRYSDGEQSAFIIFASGAQAPASNGRGDSPLSGSH
jgi:hypothetical protein